MGFASKIQGKWKALKTYLLFRKHFSNHQELFECYRKKKALPHLSLKNGLSLFSGPQDDAWSLYKEIFIDECYTKDRFYRPKDGDVIVDCGANIGFFSHFIAGQKSKAKIFSLEPSAKTMERLKKNIEANKLSEVITAIAFGLYKENTVLKLQTAQFAGSSSQYIQSDEFEMINCKTLPSLMRELKLERINLLKMDIEGAEVEVFEGIDDATWAKIDAITMEYHEENRPGSLKSLKAILEKHFPFVESWPLTKNNELGIMRAKR